MALKNEVNSSNEARPATMLVIGGGAAGMAAAGALSDKGIKVMVVETNQKVGGLAAELACKGSRECVRCDVCLGTERVREVSLSSNVQILLESQIIGVREEAGRFLVDVINFRGVRSCQEVDGIIVSTGIEPIHPEKLPRYGYNAIPGVVSALDVERELNLKGSLGRNDFKKVAFIQCVGSRGEKGGVEYCSSVCCKYALKLAKAFSNQHPDSEISFFFMDWRPCDGARADLRSWAESAKARLIRSRPAEILRSDADKPVVRYATQEEEILEEEFDLVILSVGLLPSAGTIQAAGILGLELDEGGFIKTVTGSSQASRQGIFVAGAASGPCDLERSVTSGIAAASEAAAFLRKTSGLARVAVLGRIDEDLVDESKRLGLEVIPVPWDWSLALELKGKVGDFVLSVKGEEQTSIPCGALVISLSAKSCPKRSGIISLEEFERLSPLEQAALDTAFILQESGDCSARYKHHERALEIALRIKEGSPSRKVTIIAPEFLAFSQLERLYKKCQESGVAFFRQNDPPILLEEKLEVFDPIAKTKLHVGAQRVVSGGDHIPAEARAKLLDLRLNLEEDGRSENRPIKWKPSSCLRKGIYLCGSPWATEESRRLDLRAALGQALALLQSPITSELQAQTDQEKCSACLTCVRTCPFEAPFMNREGLAEIDSGLCQGCGICVGACPSGAIALKAIENSEKEDQ